MPIDGRNIHGIPVKKDANAIVVMEPVEGAREFASSLASALGAQLLMDRNLVFVFRFDIEHNGKQFVLFVDDTGLAHIEFQADAEACEEVYSKLVSCGYFSGEGRKID